MATKIRNRGRMLRSRAHQAGVTTIEYALIGSLIAAVCVVTIGAVGANVGQLYTLVCNEVTTAISGAPGC